MFFFRGRGESAPCPLLPLLCVCVRESRDGGAGGAPSPPASLVLTLVFALFPSRCVFSRPRARKDLIARWRPPNETRPALCGFYCVGFAVDARAWPHRHHAPARGVRLQAPRSCCPSFAARPPGTRDAPFRARPPTPASVTVLSFAPIRVGVDAVGGIRRREARNQFSLSLLPSHLHTFTASPLHPSPKMSSCGCKPDCACGAASLEACKCCCKSCGQSCSCADCKCSKTTAGCCAGGEGCCASECKCGEGCSCGGPACAPTAK